MRDGARAIWSGRRRDRADVGAVHRRSAIDRGQPVESRIGEHARLDARFSSSIENGVNAREIECYEGRSLATGGIEGDEESRDRPSVLLGGVCLSGRRQMKLCWTAIAFALLGRVALQKR